MLGWILIAVMLPGDIAPPGVGDPPALGRAVRFATFHASLNREHSGDMVRDLAAPDDPQARNVAEIIQRARPDVLLINEFDDDPEGRGPALFQDNDLAQWQGGAGPIDDPHRYAAEVNTGVPSGLDLDGNGQAVASSDHRLVYRDVAID